MFLEQIGADSRVAELFRPYVRQGLELGRVSFAAHEQYRIYLESVECDAAPTGRLRWGDELPAVGDWVAARRIERGLVLIEAVLPRRTRFSRRAAGREVTEQVIAANVDLAAVVCGLDGDFNLRRLERYLTLVRESGAAAIVVLNKADVCDSVSERVNEVTRLGADVPVIAICARATVDPLRDMVRGRTVVLLGSSGAGKSTIVNGLLGEERQATAVVREADSKGRHTTTNRMLLPLPGGGATIDNPGLRELQLWASQDSLEDIFQDVAGAAGNCRFRDCTHENEPGCAVQSALESGGIDPARWLSYRKLQAELRHTALEQDARAKAAQKKRWKAMHRALRDHPKYRR
jgi:ribosome biogenesis GTPase / thiamine phosphate phosphatase